MEFRLVNPYIRGNVNLTFSGKNKFDAAKKCWGEISQYFTNNVPQFAFSMVDQKGGMHHFMVKETQDGGYAEFQIGSLPKKVAKAKETKLKNKINKFDKVMSGGDKKKDEEDDSSSSDDYSVAKKFKDEYDYMLQQRYDWVVSKGQPIVWWWYDPFPYTIQTFFVPTFVAPLTPYVEIHTGFY
jgi:hypothetical protein